MQHITSPNEIAKKYNRIIIKTKCNDKETECSICFNSIYMNSVTHLPCTHFFHTKCFNTAVYNKLYTCPLCRFDLTLQLKSLGISIRPTINEIYDDFFTYPYDYLLIDRIIDRIIIDNTFLQDIYIDQSNNVQAQDQAQDQATLINDDLYNYIILFYL